MPKVSIFIRSYAKDYPWLKLCLQTLKMRTKEVEVIVAVPDTDYQQLIEMLGEDGVSLTSLTFSLPAVCQDQYVDQQVSKCRADQFCHGDFILHIDSDCLLRGPLDIDSYFVGDRPKLLFRRWEEAGTAVCWKSITQDVLKTTPHFEFMPSCGILYHRSTHELFRRYIEGVHQMSFDDFMRRRPYRSFSEFNAIGNFSHLFTPDAYHFVRCIGPGVDSYPRPFRQFFSHDGVEKHAEEINSIMS